MEPLQIRPAGPEDAGLLLEFLHELSAYEKVPRIMKATEAGMRAALSATPPAFETVFGCVDGVPVGVATYFAHFSTRLGKFNLYLHDLYVRESHRTRGYGRQLFERVAAVGRERGCAGVTGLTLAWNRPAVDFYRKLGAPCLEDPRLFYFSIPAEEKRT